MRRLIGVMFFFVAVFTAEYLARFWATPLPKKDFVLEPFKLVDFLAIAPFYLELAIGSSSVDTRVLQAIRLVRILLLL